MTDKPLITPQNVPLWTVAGFILALLALVVAFAGLYRTNMVLLATQAQVMVLNKKIETAKAPQPAATMGAAPAPVAPAAPAEK